MKEHGRDDKKSEAFTALKEAADAIFECTGTAFMAGESTAKASDRLVIYKKLCEAGNKVEFAHSELHDLLAAAPSHVAPPDMTESGWTPIQALYFYADGKHFDVVDGRTRILDTGAVASDALKGASPEYADGKGCAPSATRDSEFKPTHRHADGGEYEMAQRCHIKLDGQEEWEWGVIYRNVEGSTYVTNDKRWNARFVRLSDGRGDAHE